MKTFHIYQRVVSAERHLEVNRVGWEGCDWSDAYCALGSVWNDTPELGAKIREAVGFDLYRHGWTVEAEEVDETFTVTNYMAPLKGTPVAWKAYKALSGSVGDVAIDEENNGWLCLSCGWAELPDDLVRWFQCSVSTRIFMGAAA